MRSKKTQVIPARLEAGRRRFERWRGTRTGRSRIPERLWTSAVRLVGVYGLCRTARTLRLDYNALKRRVESAGVNGSPAGPVLKRRMSARSTSTERKSAQAPAMTFVELPPLEPAGVPECIVELDYPRGAKMRIRLTGRQSPEVVAALSQVFLGAGS
jgi:hypothetical protein